MTEVLVRILGPLEVLVDGQPIPLGGVKQRSILGLLLTHTNRVVSTERIVEALWGEEANERAQGTVQVHVSNLRRVLAPAASALGRDQLVVTRPPGYLITLDATQLDLLAFEQHVDAARSHRRQGRGRDAVRSYRAALELWRGDPLADLPAGALPPGVIARLSNTRTSVLGERFEAELEWGSDGRLISELEDLVEAESLNEHLWGLLMVALYRAGRQADALAAFQRARATLIGELGLEPGPALRDLEARVLAQDTSLEQPSTTAASGISASGGISATVLRSSIELPEAAVVHDGRRIALVKFVTSIGRRSDQDIVLADREASRAHAQIVLSPDGFMIIDSGSSNGTSVNGVRVQKHLLAPGDEIVIGDSSLRFEQEGRRQDASGGTGSPAPPLSNP